MTDAYLRSSKLVSLVLRHRPQDFGISLDAHGYAKISEVLALLAKQGMPARREDLDQLITGRDKQRFELDATQTLIRATHGHSVKVDLGGTPVTPPAELFHGTLEPLVASVLAEGLKPMQRQYVHLSSTREAAVQVASRRGEAVVIVVEAGKMHAEGTAFFHSPGDVWLTREVAARYLKKP